MHPSPAPAGPARPPVAVGVIGASGYSGLEATRLLARHPGMSLRVAASDRWAGETVGRRLAVRGDSSLLTYLPLARAEAAAAQCEAVLLCTPAETSLELVPRLLAAGVRVVDLSGAFRLVDPGAYPAFYGFAHPHPQLLGGALYGLPELARGPAQQRRWQGARLLANPGCYPTAVGLALGPLVRHRLIETDSLVIDAASGVTGAGRKATEPYSFAELDGDYRAYRIIGHQHVPEIAQILGGQAADGEAGRRGAGPNGGPSAGVDSLPDVESLVFVPHLLPVRRGILVTAHARLRAGVPAGRALEVLEAAYAGEPFVEVRAAAEEVTLRSAVGTNRCVIGVAAAAARRGGRLVVLSAIDNLLKGAAGQAVQNLNLAFGLEESAGLEGLSRGAP